MRALVAALTRGREDAQAQQEQHVSRGGSRRAISKRRPPPQRSPSQPELLIQVFSILMEPHALDFPDALANAMKAEREAAAAAACARAAARARPGRRAGAAADGDVARRRGGWLDCGDRVRRQHRVADPRRAGFKLSEWSATSNFSPTGRR